jgi:dolichol-phosphate mannosyltransferase
MKKFDLILPVYNEAEIIEVVIDQLLQELTSDFYLTLGMSFNQIVVVEDGSNDGTSEILKSIGQSRSNIKLLQSRTRLGYVVALNHATSFSSADYLIFCDSSGKYTVKDLRSLASKINDFNLVIGKRNSFHDVYYRLILRKMLNKLVSRICGVSISDIDSPVRIIKKSLIDEINKFPRVEKYLYNLENTLIAIRELNSSYCEVEINYSERTNGKSRGIPANRIPKVIFSAIKTLIFYRYK